VIVYDGSVTGSVVVDVKSFAASGFASYVYNPVTGVFGEQAEAGRFGAYASLGPGSTGSLLPAVASPGVIPEPGGVVVAGLLGVGLTGRCRVARP
jgi:hypothetical protein